MKMKRYFKRLKEEKFSPLFILSRIILRLNIKLPFTVSLDKDLKGKIYLHPSPFPHNLFIKRGYYKSDNLVIKKFIKQGDTVFDVGADLGSLTILFSFLCGKAGHVFSFEPTKRTFKFLQENIKLNNVSNVFAINAAITEINGEVYFVEHRYSHGFNYVDKEESKNNIKVNSLRLDWFLQEHNIDKIDFLKIDTEGSEFNVLKSLGEQLAIVKKIYFEFHTKNYERIGYKATEIIGFLKNNNFDIFIPDYREKDIELIPFREKQTYLQKMNLLAINKAHE